MDEMRAIIQIQAQIDAFLVEGGEEGLFSARLEAMARGEPDPRLVRQAIKLLRMRQRLLQVNGMEMTLHVRCARSRIYYMRIIYMCTCGFGGFVSYVLALFLIREVLG